MLKMLAIFAELERSFIRERTTAELAAARAQGRVGGRPKVTDTKQARQAQTLRDSGERAGHRPDPRRQHRNRVPHYEEPFEG